MDYRGVISALPVYEKSAEISVEIRIVDSAAASDILKITNTKNRAVSQHTVDKYCKLIDEEKWKVNGEPIIISKAGRLLNGQHRLLAQTKAEKPTSMLFITGIEDDAFNTIDTGKARGAADLVSIDHETSRSKSSSLTCVATMLMNLERGYQPTTANHIASMDVANYVTENYDELSGNYDYLRSFEVKPLLSFNDVVFVYTAAKRLHPDKVDDFFVPFITGARLESGTPVYMLYHRVQKCNNQNKRITKKERIAWMIQCFNAYLRNGTIKYASNIALRKGQDFPVITNTQGHQKKKKPMLKRKSS